jgi:hypothetical protein
VRYGPLLAIVTLAAYAAASSGAAAFIAVAWSRNVARLAALPAITRARLILAGRLGPAIVGALGCGVTLTAFLRHEPGAMIETPGWPLFVAAAFALILAGMSVALLIVRSWRTSRFFRAAERAARPVTLPGVTLPAWQVETAFPLVALAGVWRPRLLIARRVLEQLPDDELQVVLQHELAHARQRDNVARWLVAGLPDALGLAEPWLGLERAWHDAAEDAADDLATRNDPPARARLASALVRVARMAGRQPHQAIPLLAFHKGESIERRVRRLIGAPVARSPVPARLAVFAAIAVLAAAFGLWANVNLVLLAVHRATEWLVNARP